MLEIGARRWGTATVALNIAALALLPTIHVALAGEVALTRDPRYPNVAQINISGAINPGDEEIAHSLSMNEKRVIFELDSPGGSVKSALAIGAWTRLMGFATSVGPHHICASACALIWLGGNHRYVAPSAKIGFHAAYLQEGAHTSENGAANAKIGAYLTYLGLSVDVVQFVTEAPPSGMRWLTVEEARKLGISLEMLPEQGGSR